MRGVHAKKLKWNENTLKFSQCPVLWTRLTHGFKIDLHVKIHSSCEGFSFTKFLEIDTEIEYEN